MKLIEPPAAAVTLTEAKRYLRVEHSDHDALITEHVAAATAWFDGPEGRLRRAIMPQTWELALDAFPEKEIWIPLAPVISIESVKYDDAAGDEQTVDTADYTFDAYGDPCKVVPVTAWPTAMETTNAVRVQWVAGMALESEDSPGDFHCPAEIKVAILLKVAELYDGSDASAAIDALIHIRKRVILA